MHDGQMLFDARTTWNKQAWNVDVTLTRLMRAGRIPDTIVVGIWNVPNLRYAEFYPQGFLALTDERASQAYVQEAQSGKPLANAYLRFIVEELKPAIDQRFSTRPERKGTFVMGSSMGGMISLYALCEYPQVFAGAAGLSTHWVGHPTAWGLERVRNAAMPLGAFRYLESHLPAPGAHRIYTDRGSVGLDALYAPSHAFVAELFRQRGYSASQATTQVFEGTSHTESDWSSRLEVPVLFLMGKP
jgi:pimeloyl-ACP methyl ester carboxylesterase